MLRSFHLPPAPWWPSATAPAWYSAGMHQDEAREPLQSLQRGAYALRSTPVLTHEAPRRGRPWCGQCHEVPGVPRETALATREVCGVTCNALVLKVLVAETLRGLRQAWALACSACRRPRIIP